jgi:hypothetical protein
LRVDAGRERARDLDPFPQVRTEALSYEGDCVYARPKILDPVLTAAIRDDGADLFNQRGALGLDGDVRKGGARRVMHNASNRLRECPTGNARSQCEEKSERPTSTHEHFSLLKQQSGTRFRRYTAIALET